MKPFAGIALVLVALLRVAVETHVPSPSRAARASVMRARWNPPAPFSLASAADESINYTPRYDGRGNEFHTTRDAKGEEFFVFDVEIDLLPIPEFYGGALYFDGNEAPAVLRAWHGWCAGLPENVNTSIALQRLPPLPGVPDRSILTCLASVPVRSLTVTSVTMMGLFRFHS